MRKKIKTVFLGNIALTIFLLSTGMMWATNTEYTIRQLIDNDPRKDAKIIT